MQSSSAFMHTRQQAVIRGCVYVFMGLCVCACVCVREKGTEKIRECVEKWKQNEGQKRQQNKEEDNVHVLAHARYNVFNNVLLKGEIIDHKNKTLHQEQTFDWLPSLKVFFHKSVILGWMITCFASTNLKLNK